MEALFRRLNNLDLDGQTQRDRFDLRSNVVFHVSPKNPKIGCHRFWWRGEELLTEAETPSKNIDIISVLGVEDGCDYIVQEEINYEQVRNALASTTDLANLTLSNLQAGYTQVDSLISTFEELAPKILNLNSVRDVDNTILQHLWNILGKGQTKHIFISDCEFGSELKELILGWIGLTPDWSDLKIEKLRSEEDCKLMLEMAEEVLKNWRELMEIEGNCQMIEIVSPEIYKISEPGSFFEDHVIVREASTQISVLQDETRSPCFLRNAIITCAEGYGND
ncbi:hypothetical protein L596_023740 [Steinernema carpocapsae]|uniref:Uncharacterized protein n=1 Tax=Steinernema carpocapsae TaxID=34508 RepID=A0A4U5MEJ6_STECR|nr:hypothetical protein L596_023740 [Steinernema carpocapsae]